MPSIRPALNKYKIKFKMFFFLFQQLNFFIDIIPDLII